MLSYQHSYHAGNFADVVKHLTLSRIIHYLTQKDKPLSYIETHAGRGVYDFYDKQASKNKEYLQGAKLIWDNAPRLNELFDSYLSTLKKLNSTSQLRYYGGSPYLAISQLRAIDRLFLFEWHTYEYDYLKQLARQGKKVFFTYDDGLKNLLGLLPPLEKRGLIFIDPSYEVKADYQAIPNLLNEAQKRFATGVYCLWYPIIDKLGHEQFIRRLKRNSHHPCLQIEFFVNKNLTFGMQGCGLWIINPPYLLAEEMENILRQLSTIINPGQSAFLINSL